MTSLEWIPNPDAIPVSWGWFQVLLIVTFVIHLIFMNTMLGSGIIALYYSIRKRQHPDPIEQEISKKWPFSVAFTVNTGVAPFLFLQVLYGTFIYSSSILMGWYWLAMVGMLLIAYYSAYIYDYKFSALKGLRTLVLAVGVMLLLAVGFLFVNNMTLMIKPASWQTYFQNPKGTILNWADPTLFPRYLHFVVASVAIGGLALAVFYTVRARKEENKQNPDIPQNIARSMTWFSYATLVQIMVGLWFLMTLPKPIIQLFMNARNPAGLLLMMSVAMAIVSVILGFKQKVYLTAASTLVTITVMVLTRDVLRRAMLDPYFNLKNLTVTPQYSPMIMFLAAAIIGTMVVIYMLRLARTQTKEA